MRTIKLLRGLTSSQGLQTSLKWVKMGINMLLDLVLDLVWITSFGAGFFLNNYLTDGKADFYNKCPFH